MLGSLSDTLIIIFISILMLGCEKDLSGTARKIGKMWGDLRRSERDFRREITRELNVDDLGIDFSDNRKPYNPNDARVRELERQVRELQEEMERMKRQNGKD
jgi:Sec-independent protein translocase protein TatA